MARLNVLIWFLLVIVSAAVKLDRSRPDVALFDDEYVAKLENQLGKISAWQLQRLLSKLGKLALYARLYKAWTRNPRTGKRGFDKYFPQPSITFHTWVYNDCSLKILDCVDKVFANVQNRSSILFTTRGQTLESLKFDETIFTRSVTNTMFAYDVSFMYLMCFLTNNRLSVLRVLPFCTYGIEPHQNRLWPSALFQDAKNRANVVHVAWPGAEPIDHFINQSDFQCSDESFCPDPCCGRRSRRSATGGNFCRESVCLHNDYHWGEDSSQSTTNFSASSTEPPDGIFSTKSSLMNSIPAEDESGLTIDEASHSCHVEAFFNDDIRAMMANRWNLSCACVMPSTGEYHRSASDTLNLSLPSSAGSNGGMSVRQQYFMLDPSRIYRFDVKMCVDIDECLYVKCEIENEECVNTVGGHFCVCKLGYLRRNSTCEPVDLTGNLNLWRKVLLTP